MHFRQSTRAQVITYTSMRVYCSSTIYTMLCIYFSAIDMISAHAQELVQKFMKAGGYVA